MDTDRLNSMSLAFVEGLYADWVRDPGSVTSGWRTHFESLEAGDFAGRPQLGPSFRPRSLFDPAGRTNGALAGPRSADDVADLQDRADQLMRSYRVRGHMVARIDPLGRPRAPQPELDPSFYGFTEQDLERRVSAQTFPGASRTSLRATVERMRNTYCRSIGVQFMHIDDLSVKRWLQERMEGSENRLELGRAEQLRILTKLTDAVIFEEFVQKKYLGAKSFSLEGSESLIPLLDLAIQRAGESGVEEIVLGMAHRGRLNVLANILRKSPRRIFREFEDTDPELHMGRGDVKYHLGHSSDYATESGRNVHLSLCFNPSHLEFVDPVAVGRIRAKQDRFDDPRGDKGFALLIHGDAAFAGEGVVAETLNLSQLEGYTTGGTLHVIVNNQIGFTTRPEDSRSSTYCTDVAKMLQIPIFHVNGEDPEAVAQVVRLAMEFRRAFRRDVVIDMYGYRRRGHNEGDEPSFTDPLLYQAIGRRKDVREGYFEHLEKLGEVTREEADEIARQRRADLEQELAAARSGGFRHDSDAGGGVWSGYQGGSEADLARVETAVERGRLAELLEKLTHVPDGFHLHPKLRRQFDQRLEMARGERPLDWAAAEALAFASLAVEGHRVRLTGQDSERGTFSHRHAVLHDVDDGKLWCPLQHLTDDQAPVEIRNSPLSETGVLGFEYGYSLDTPDALVAWEAQFGDFVNVAQVIIDQFIVSAEDKWRRLSALVMLLPHGFEGMGPEHSSARLDRFLALAADENIQVVYPSTPAQYFHCLRRQVLRPWRKPLIVMTPKSGLRHPRVVSDLEQLSGSSAFQRILPDPLVLDPAGVKRVLLASGKICIDLEEQRESTERSDVAILRLEQIYPLQPSDIEQALAPYATGTPVVWVQEEPENMGTWRFLRARYGERLLGRWPFGGIHREASASPATGSMASHKIEQRALVDQSFDLS